MKEERVGSRPSTIRKARQIGPFVQMLQHVCAYMYIYEILDAQKINLLVKINLYHFRVILRVIEIPTAEALS